MPSGVWLHLSSIRPLTSLNQATLVYAIHWLQSCGGLYNPESTVFSWKMRYTLLCVSESCVFPVFLAVFGRNLLYWEFKKMIYSKKPVYVTKLILVTTLITSFISAYDSTAQDLAARIHQKMTTFKPLMRILWHNANSLELLNPENDWPWHCSTTYPKAKKATYSPFNTGSWGLSGSGT